MSTDDQNDQNAETRMTTNVARLTGEDAARSTPGTEAEADAYWDQVARENGTYGQTQEQRMARETQKYWEAHYELDEREAAEDAARSDQLLAEAGATLDADAAVAYGIPDAWVPDPDARYRDWAQDEAYAQDADRAGERLAEADVTDFEDLEAETEALAAMSPQEAEAAGYLPGIADPVRATWLHPDAANDLAQAHYEATAEDEWRQVTGRPPTGHLAVGSHTSRYAPRIEEGQTFGWKPSDAAEPGTPFGGWIYPRSVSARDFNATATAEDRAQLAAVEAAGHQARSAPDTAPAVGLPAWNHVAVDLTPTSAAQVAGVLARFVDEHPHAERADLFDLQVYTPTEPEGVYEDDWAHTGPEDDAPTL